MAGPARRPPPGVKRPDRRKLAARSPAHLEPRIAAALAQPLPPSVDHSLLPVTDQGETSTCTWHALAKAIEILTGTCASMRVGYALTGELEADPRDDGRQLVDCLTVARSFGVAPFGGPVEGRNSDISVANVCAPVTPVERASAAGRLVDLGQATILARAPNVSDLCAAALAAGSVIYLGTQVGQAFEHLSGQTVAVPDPTNDPDGGGHALLIVGYRTLADGSRAFIVQNSWGEAWDLSGECLASVAWVAACWELHPLLLPVSAPDPVKPGFWARLGAWVRGLI